MKITEASIDHNALKLIDDIILEPCDYTEDKDVLIVTLGEVRGVILMAQKMKEVLKV